jgi:hypothetical protein
VADSKLLQIMDALVAKSAAIPGVGATGLLCDVGLMWADADRTPASYLGEDGEDLVEKPTASLEGDPALLYFYTVCKGDGATRLFHAFYKEHKDRIDQDPTLGGLCFRARVTGYLALHTAANIAQRVHVARINVSVNYRVPRGTA